MQQKRHPHLAQSNKKYLNVFIIHPEYSYKRIKDWIQICEFLSDTNHTLDTLNTRYQIKTSSDRSL